jgi:hypothetical protein
MMKRPANILLAASLSICALCASAATVGEVQAVRGSATALFNGQSIPLAPGSKIESGSEIQTAAQGRLKIRFIDGSVVILSDGSTLRVTDFVVNENSRRKSARFELDIGLISQRVAPSENGSWNVKTPTVVTAVRGTEYIIEVKPDKGTDVSIQSGAVSVNSLKKTRALPVILKTTNAGTNCDSEGTCSAAKEWNEERLKAVQDRLGGF